MLATYSSRPGIQEAMRGGKKVSIYAEGSRADFDRLMLGLVTIDPNSITKNAMYILPPTSIEDLSAVEAEIVDFQDRLLTSAIADLLKQAQGSYTVGLPIVYRGHWYYSRLTVENGRLTAMTLIDSKDETRMDMVMHVLNAIQPFNQENTVEFKVENTGFQEIGNTCMDWVAREALLDLSIATELTEAVDDASVRAVTSQMIQQQTVNPNYDELLELLNDREEEDMSAKFQIELDRRLAEAYAKRLGRAEAESAANGKPVPNDEAVFEAAKRDVSRIPAQEIQIAVDTRPPIDDEARRLQMIAFKQRFFQIHDAQQRVTSSNTCREAADLQIAQTPTLPFVKI